MTLNHRPRSALFERCRGIHPAQVALDAGLHVAGHGALRYACCPFHPDRRPSLAMTPRGTWRCYGCGRHGDTTDLYASLHGLSPAAAARALHRRYLEGCR